MPAVARLGDLLDHLGARIITGSPTRFVNGRPVARLGDLVWCPWHGMNPIIETHFPLVTTEGKPVAHIGAKCFCGAKIITGSDNVFVDAGTPGDIIALTFMGNDDPGGNGGVIPPTPGGRAPTRDEQHRSRAIAPEPAGPTIAEDTTVQPPEEALPTDCAAIKEPVPGDFRLSANYTLAHLSTGVAVQSHTVRAQRGLTVAQIVCNLKAVAENVLEPLRAKYPGLIVNSGFRGGNGTSQHELGQAVDVSFADVSKTDRRTYYERALWVSGNMQFDQLIFEYPRNTSWLHISYKSSGLRKQVNSYWGHGYPAGLILKI